MRKKRTVVKRISLDTARTLLRDIRTLSLEKTGARHGIKNYETIPRLISRTFEREGRRVPRLVQQGPAGISAGPTVAVNRKGTIVLPKEIVTSFGLGTGRKLSARRHGTKIVLDIVSRPRGRKAKAKTANGRRRKK